jgi:transcriptional regulator GlxA family with amidase domain
MPVRPPKDRARTVGVVVFDGVSPFHLGVPCGVFGEDRRDAGLPPHRVLVCSDGARPVATSAGFVVDVPHDLDALRRAGTVIVPTWRDPSESPPEPILDAIRRAHRRGARVVGLCLGAFVLAASGVLDGRPATTHWLYVDELSRRFPSIEVHADQLYVDDGDVITSAGTAAAIDCCLHLVRRDHGAEVANGVARRMVTPPHRAGGQAQFIEHPVANAEPPGSDEALRSTMAWAAEHLDEPLGVDRLAARAHMSRRSFSRHFREVTGTTPLQWILRQRIELAQRLLETSDRPVEHVATAAGFGSAVAMRQHFHRSVGTSPQGYRRAFRGADAG